jgi:hypothetical protein
LRFWSFEKGDSRAEQFMNDANKYLNNLSHDEFDLLYLKLVKYSVNVAKSKKWRTGNYLELPGGETPDSIVSSAFEKVLAGDRVWNSEKNPDFKKYMFDVIDSLLSHLATGGENKLFVNEKDDVDVLAVAEEGFVSSSIKGQYRNADWLVRKQLTPEEEAIAGEEKEFNSQVLRGIYDLIADDAELVAVVEAMRCGYEKSADIAEHTGIAVERIYNARKRLDRVAAKARKQFDI